MGSSSIFNSENGEKRWVFQMDKNFSPEQVVDIDFDVPTSVFRVPKTFTETKPEAYAPQRLGLGPYHHFRPELYPMQKHKLAAVRKFLGHKHTFQEVVECLVKCEPMLRACYDQYLDFDIQTLARAIAVDALYFLHLLEHYNDQPAEAEDTEIRELENDIFMLENQIPVILLQKIKQVLDCDHSSLCYQFQGILYAHSPLELSKHGEIVQDENQFHLLHRLYHLIVNNTGTSAAWISTSQMAINDEAVPFSLTEFSNVVEFLGNQGLPGAAVAGEILSVVEKIPWDRILALFKKDDGESLIIVEEIDIPSVSEMTEKAGIKFNRAQRGIRDIEYRENEEGYTFYLPVIYVKPTSEIILRNLMAFEAVLVKPATAREFAQYVDLMCGIIDTKKDVDILRKARIIESELDDENVVGIFNGIRKTTVENEKLVSKIEQAIDAGRKQYGNVFSVRAKRFVSSYGPWLFKNVKLVIYVLILVMLTLQNYCSVFGCSHWFDKSNIDRMAHSGYDLLHSHQ